MNVIDRVSRPQLLRPCNGGQYANFRCSRPLRKPRLAVTDPGPAKRPILEIAQDESGDYETVTLIMSKTG